MFKALLGKFTNKEMEEYSRTFSEIDRETYFFNRYIEEEINPFLRGKLLESCAGVSTSYLKYPKNAVSVDINYEMLRNIVNENIPVAGDIQKLPFANDTFNSILIMHGIHHIGEDKVHYMNYISPVVAESHRVLKKGGYLTIVEGGVSHFVHLLIYAMHFLIRSVNSKFYYEYDIPLLYSRKILDIFFPENMFMPIYKRTIKLPRLLYFKLEPMFCIKFRFPLILLPQRPVIYVLQKK